MCGFIAAFGNAQQVLGSSALCRALERMRRRGPDDEGTRQGEGVVLGHRRLAILDLDPRAAQPMQSLCGRYVIVFNGEIYNFRTLRRDLESRGVVFRTTSDTEVILALFAAEGEAMLAKLHGMFALAIWDCVARRAFIARDPYGIKPLYVTEAPDTVMVASQVKALLATGGVSRDPDPRGQAGFWMLGSVPEPHTWFRDIRTLPAGHWAWIENGRLGPARCWHDIGDVWRGAAQRAAAVEDVAQRVQAALRESVARHLVADVPVGVFLSGGIDSGALVGLMVEAGARELEGVTIAYDEFAGRHEDEAPVAAGLAAHYGIRHSVRRVTRDEFLTDLPRILDAMDQPSIDGVNTWYASKAAAERGLKAVVSGVGGDELFQGYSSFRTLPRLLSLRCRLRSVPGATSLMAAVGRVQARRSGNRRWRHLVEWSGNIEGLWWLRRSVCAPEDLVELMGPELARAAIAAFDATVWVREMAGPVPEDPKLAIAQIESMAYLRNQLLRDSDWASMDHSVELRTPLVDAYLLGQVRALLPQFAKFHNKTLLANSPGRALPSGIIKRTKTGFGIPIGRWLQDHPGSRSWPKELVAAYEASA
ncbi:MAG: asparagine synthase (glutamine-hydrolyzing) [Gammaproteobacteria bacterium]|nr:MAG: asparagine synthase (glutamine-hydrolyzing) [Gammaproteobacteria bacterium]TLZ40073.1 MAG: asparagine synthase (glutamine-hydrolyzing) [Gammaproteobacteria bacterium]